MYMSSVSTYYEDILLVKKIQKVIARYIRGYFLIDFLGTFPFFAFVHNELLAFKMLRILKMKLYFTRINTFVEDMLSGYLHSRKELLVNIQKAVRFLILLAFTMHVLACIWIWLGKEDEHGWVTTKSEIISNPNSNFDLYVAAIYWVMTTFTTVGYGDFTGCTNSEYIFQMVAQFVGIGFFGYIIGNISTMIGQVDTLQELQEEEEENQNIWQMKLSRSYKDKILSSHYYNNMNLFFISHWNMDF